ncbi:MAG: ABC transporter permease [Acidobacteriota bacterium]|nr:ABC transporter permease [Acidobacteriota bacterium]
MEPRISPALGWSRGRRSWWYHASFYTQTWRGSAASTILFPFLYLTSLGVGVGHLVQRHTGLVQGQTYLHYIAPSLLATTAMTMGESESLWPVLASVKWLKTYHAAVATPLSPVDVLVGKLSWVTTKCFATSVIYTVAISLFGATRSWWALTLPFIGALVALAFSAPLVAYAAGAESDASFTTIYRFAFIPMFLFSATFFPIASYPRVLRPLVQLFPLYHGVALARAAAFGQGSFHAISVHLAVLVSMVLVGLWWGRRSMTRRLVD